MFVPSEGYTVSKNVAYGTHARQTLDVYRPDGLTSPAPVVVFFYGGRWQSGSKEDYRFVGQAFASRGYVTVIADYRLYPSVRYPDFLRDGAQAVAFARAHAAEYGGDGSQLFLAGHSAGAYNVMMLAMDGGSLEAAGGGRGWLSGVIGLAGPYDFLPFTDEDVRDIFSPSPDALTQPVHYARAGMPPMLLATGDADTDVKPRNTASLAAGLRAHGNEVTVKTYPGLAHVGIVLALAQGFRGKAPVLDDAATFIEAHRHAR